MISSVSSIRLSWAVGFGGFSHTIELGRASSNTLRRIMGLIGNPTRLPSALMTTVEPKYVLTWRPSTSLTKVVAANSSMRTYGLIQRRLNCSSDAGVRTIDGLNGLDFKEGGSPSGDVRVRDEATHNRVGSSLGLRG